MKSSIPHKYYAKHCKQFIAMCEVLGVAPTARQAAKYRMGIGIVKEQEEKALELLKEKTN